MPETTQPVAPAFPGIELNVIHIRAAMVRLATTAERERAVLVAQWGGVPSELSVPGVGTEIGRAIISPVEAGCHGMLNHLARHLANLVGEEEAQRTAAAARAEGKQAAAEAFEEDCARVFKNAPKPAAEPKPRTRRAAPPASTARH